MTTRSMFLLLTVVAFGLAGCDAGDATDDLGTSDVRANEDAAVSIANALGVDSGGALEDVASAAATGGDFDGKSAQDFGCEHRLAYSEDTQLWTRSVACERGREGSPFFAQFSRLHEFQFLVGDVPQQFPEGATTQHFRIVEGTGERHTPVSHHVLNNIGGNFVIDDFDQELVTVNGEYTRAATDTLETRRAVRTLDYTLDLTLIDLVGPRHRDVDAPRDRGWHHAVSGTIEGQYSAFVTFETARGYREQEIDRTFVITFGGETDQPELLIDDERFTLDLETGTVVGVPMD